MRGLDHGYARIDVNDSHDFTFSAFDADGNYRTLVYRKSDKVWHALPFTGKGFTYIRGFGRYLAVTETQTKNDRNPRSAGTQSWKKERRRDGPDISDREENWGQVFPGRINIYDVDTDRAFPINTGQGDSEVLLVEAGVVYYRVMDKLYSAPVTAQGVGTATLLATDDAILDAHWAWIKR